MEDRASDGYGEDRDRFANEVEEILGCKGPIVPAVRVDIRTGPTEDDEGYHLVLFRGPSDPKWPSDIPVSLHVHPHATTDDITRALLILAHSLPEWLPKWEDHRMSGLMGADDPPPS